ncbi:hypothetical protein BGZ51_008765 [Haplosporangium sp. Z 767]|nr:hypothetical protein BGZ51_008765 [Haplosporangium sp. Z 767]
MDSSHISASEEAVLHPDNASVHGNMWEAMMPPVFVETFKNLPLSSWPLPLSPWPLLAKNSLPERLFGHVTVVGYNEQEPELVVSHRDITIQDFMRAHVKDNSKKGHRAIPPFYFPAPQVAGPDIIFYVRIKGEIYPVFVQLKLRHILPTSDVEQALEALSDRAVQEKLAMEHDKQQKAQEELPKKQNQHNATTCAQSPAEQARLQDYCPSEVYISLVITYPVEVVKMQTLRPDPEPELEGLQRVSINVDDINAERAKTKRRESYE